MKNFSIIFFITLGFFLILNILIVFTWPIYSKFKSDNHNYSIEQKKLLNLSDDNLIILKNETWKNYDKFSFKPFIGHTETNRKGKFVNFSEQNGRKINRPSQCVRNVHLYGGSTTFGYNVTDDQTIGQQLQNLFDDKTCVFNHGRAYFYSKQENNLFINHLENQKKIDYAIFLDGVNERCGGYVYDSYLNQSFNLLTEKPYKMWKEGFKNFLLTLPLTQFINSIFGSSRFVNNDLSVLKIDSCNSKIELSKLFKERLLVRKGICENNNIDCHTFLQPMPGVHGIQIEKLLSKKGQIDFQKKYKLLSEVKGLIDLGYIFNKEEILSYIDDVHYSPRSNYLIASAIFQIIENNE